MKGDKEYSLQRRLSLICLPTLFFLKPIKYRYVLLSQSVRILPTSNSCRLPPPPPPSFPVPSAQTYRPIHLVPARAMSIAFPAGVLARYVKLIRYRLGGRRILILSAWAVVLLCLGIVFTLGLKCLAIGPSPVHSLSVGLLTRPLTRVVLHITERLKSGGELICDC